MLQSRGVINHISLGEDIFIKHWKSREKNIAITEDHYSFYEINELSFSYFISNLIESVVEPIKVLDKLWFLYPIKKPNGKEDALIRDLYISDVLERKE